MTPTPRRAGYAKKSKGDSQEANDIANPMAARRRGEGRGPQDIPTIPAGSRVLIHVDEDHVSHLIGTVHGYEVDRGLNYGIIIGAVGAGYRRYLAAALTDIAGQLDALAVCGICGDGLGL